MPPPAATTGAPIPPAASAQPGYSTATQFACTRSPSACCTNTRAPGSTSAGGSAQAGSRQRRAATAITAQNTANTPGVASPACPPTSSARNRHVGVQSPTRPPCLTMLAHPCAAFQASTGTVVIATASAAPAQGAGRRHHPCIPGTSSNSAAPGPSRAAVYLLSNASPDATPATSHHPPPPPAATRASAHAAAVQKNSSGVSGVIVTAPAPSISVAFSSTAARSPAPRPGNSRPAASASSTVPSAADSGASSRTPSAPSPASAVPAQIQSATIGG